MVTPEVCCISNTSFMVRPMCGQMGKTAHKPRQSLPEMQETSGWQLPWDRRSESGGFPVWRGAPGSSRGNPGRAGYDRARRGGIEDEQAGTFTGAGGPTGG
ncbi:hypothetical protein WDZ92_54290, partial [Nostoc sp. NIES-2111]